MIKAVNQQLQRSSDPEIVAGAEQALTFMHRTKQAEAEMRAQSPDSKSMRPTAQATSSSASTLATLPSGPIKGRIVAIEPESGYQLSRNWGMTGEVVSVEIQ